MRVLLRTIGSATLTLAGLLALCGRLGADTGTFQLFPPGSTPNPLLSPDPPERYTIFDTTVLLAAWKPPSGVRLDLRIPESALSLHAPESVPPHVVVSAKKPGLPGGWKPAATFVVMATAVGYSAGNSVKEASYAGTFHFTAEGFFGRNTYTGGVDKMAHFVDYTVAQRALSNTFGRIGYNSSQSGWLGFATAFAAGLTTEIGDGTTVFGFSWEDLLMDALGAGTATVLARSGWDDTFGFRFGSVDQDATPKCCVDNSNIGRDYSGEIYTADVKIAGLARRLQFNPGPARFLLFSVTYGTNGYDHVAPELRQRLVGLEVGIHFSEILRAIGVPSEPVWGEVLYFFFDTLRIPYTAIGVRYDVNNHEWFGPTAGRTTFRVPPGSR
jgi:predicted lipoprotein DUF2279